MVHESWLSRSRYGGGGHLLEDAMVPSDLQGRLAVEQYRLEAVAC